jgi:hypothetical protein
MTIRAGFYERRCRVGRRDARREMIAIIGSSAGRDSTNCSFLTFAAHTGSFAAIKAVNPAKARQSPGQLCLALNR